MPGYSAFKTGCDEEGAEVQSPRGTCSPASGFTYRVRSRTSDRHIMGLFKAGRGPRGFKYKPRFYDPDEDEDRELKRRMRARGRGRERKSSLSVVILVGLLLLTLFLYQAL